MNIHHCYWQLGQHIQSWPSIAFPEAIPALVKRRLTDLGKMGFNGFFSLKELVADKDIPWVVSCRHGDSARMKKLLTELAQDEALSPTDFSLSVHNAIAAQFAIATGNKQMQTVLSGGGESFEHGLLEAFCLQKEKGGLVGFMYYDQPLPAPFDPELTTPELCVGLILGDDIPQSERITINYLSEIPQTDIGIMDFIQFMENKSIPLQLSIPGGLFLLEYHHA